MASVDLKTASIILDKAFEESEFIIDDISSCISNVLKGTHKTYRYVLVTALIAKATNYSIDALSLQKGDGKNGQYDARSLCHKVLVPFESIKLPGSLGGSNEPFLNKPARFVSLSEKNAVRSGNDARTLSDVISILTKITDSKIAYKYLKVALSIMKEINIEYISKFSVGDTLIDISEFSQLVLDYIYTITEQSLEGEVCPLIVAQLEQLYFGKEFRVEAHKVNQSGASSKEVGDIDIYDKNKNLVYSIEIKDKCFSKQDVSHAILKFKNADLNTSLFVYGKNASFNEDEVFCLLKEYGREGHYCCLISILNYAKMRIFDIKTITVKDFVNGLLNFAKIINAKDDTVNTIKDISSKIFEKSKTI